MPYTERQFQLSRLVVRALGDHGHPDSGVAQQALQAALANPHWPSTPLRTEEDRPVSRVLVLPTTLLAAVQSRAEALGHPPDALVDLAMEEFLDHA